MMVVLMSASLADGLRVDLARSKAGIGIVVVLICYRNTQFAPILIACRQPCSLRILVRNARECYRVKSL